MASVIYIRKILEQIGFREILLISVRLKSFSVQPKIKTDRFATPDY